MTTIQWEEFNYKAKTKQADEVFRQFRDVLLKYQDGSSNRQQFIDLHRVAYEIHRHWYTILHSQNLDSVKQNLSEKKQAELRDFQIFIDFGYHTLENIGKQYGLSLSKSGFFSQSQSETHSPSAMLNNVAKKKAGS